MELSPGRVRSTALRGAGGVGAVSRITSWALPLPLETADLGGVFVVAYFPSGSQPLKDSALFTQTPPLGEVEDPLESAKAQVTSCRPPIT